MLPKEAAGRLKVAKGDVVYLTEAADGYRLTPYDPDSVMNYCNKRYNNYGRLSEFDRRALAILYGAP